MDKIAGRLTVFFEEPFWVGVFERMSGSELSAAKVTFGAEPKEYEIAEFILKKYDRLRFSPAVAAEVKEVNIPWLRSHPIRYREPLLPNDGATCI